MPSIRQLHIDACPSYPKSPHFVADIHPIHDTLARVYNGRDGSTAITTHVGRLFGDEEPQVPIAWGYISPLPKR